MNYEDHVAAERCSAGAILDRLKQALGASSDGELCRVLGIKRSTLGSWRAQDRRPYEICVALQQARGLSLDWLLTGEGPMFRPSHGDAIADASLAGPQDCARRLDALRGILDGLDPESRDAILGDAFSRATTAQRLAALSRLVESLAKAG